MTRRQRLVLFALVVPVVGTLIVGAAVIVLSVISPRKPEAWQVPLAMVAAFVFLLVYAIWLAVRGWNLPD
jgi:hypothetical protein